LSWLESIKTQFSITTGDGKVYNPSLIIATSNEAMEFNVSTFEFPNIKGTLVKRYLRKGKRYELEVIFQGDDCWDVAKAFKDSAEDTRAWVISHPVYGSLKVQPIAISDSSNLNKAVLNIPVIETITEEGAQSNISPADKIAADKETADAALADTYVENVTPAVKDKQQLTTNADNLYKEGKKTAGSASEDYLNAFNTANSYITNATTKPLLAIQKTQNLISAPAQFKDSVQNRLNTLTNQLDKLRNNVQSITQYSLKKLFENNAGTIISTMALTTVTGIDSNDYSNRKKVLQTIDRVLQSYNNYIADLDALQSPNGGAVGAYIPDATALQKLGQLVSFTISNLFVVAQQAKQERRVILDADTNWIILAHRYYGLLPDDSTIDQIMNDNDAGLLERTQVRRGREIIYYV
jgi:hypothetical protein